MSKETISSTINNVQKKKKKTLCLLIYNGSKSEWEKNNIGKNKLEW